MQNFTNCVAHAYACVASENQALQLVYPFSSKGNATSEILHTKWYPQFILVVQPPFSSTTFFQIGVYLIKEEGKRPRGTEENSSKKLNSHVLTCECERLKPPSPGSLGLNPKTTWERYYPHLQPQYILICRLSAQVYDFVILFPIRRCNGKRIWEITPGIPSQPEYECSSFGQGHIETFDGMLYNFDNTGCR